MTTFKHCDDYIDDETQPAPLRRYLERARSPGHGFNTSTEPFPMLFADYKGRRVRVVMASRFGDVGVTEVLTNATKYQTRVLVSDLSNFSETS